MIIQNKNKNKNNIDEVHSNHIDSISPTNVIHQFDVPAVVSTLVENLPLLERLDKEISNINPKIDNIIKLINSIDTTAIEQLNNSFKSDDIHRLLTLYYYKDNITKIVSKLSTISTIEEHLDTISNIEKYLTTLYTIFSSLHYINNIAKISREIKTLGTSIDDIKKISNNISSIKYLSENYSIIKESTILLNNIDRDVLKQIKEFNNNIEYIKSVNNNIEDIKVVSTLLKKDKDIFLKIKNYYDKIQSKYEIAITEISQRTQDFKSQIDSIIKGFIIKFKK